MEATASLLFSLRKRTSGEEEDEAQRENAPALVVVVIVRSFFARDAWSFVFYRCARVSKSDRSKDGFPEKATLFFSETLSNTVGKSKKRTRQRPHKRNARARANATTVLKCTKGRRHKENNG